MNNQPPTHTNPPWTAPQREEPIDCPHCGEPTMPNLLADASHICSCPAQRALPLPSPQGRPLGPAPSWMPSPVDDASFIPSGLPESPRPVPDDGLPPGVVAETRARPRPEDKPQDHGQFGAGVTTEDYRPLPAPPADPALTPETGTAGTPPPPPAPRA